MFVFLDNLVCHGPLPPPPHCHSGRSSGGGGSSSASGGSGGGSASGKSNTPYNYYSENGEAQGKAAYECEDGVDCEQVSECDENDTECIEQVTAEITNRGSGVGGETITSRAFNPALYIIGAVAVATVIGGFLVKRKVSYTSCLTNFFCIRFVLPGTNMSVTVVVNRKNLVIIMTMMMMLSMNYLKG